MVIPEIVGNVVVAKVALVMAAVSLLVLDVGVYPVVVPSTVTLMVALMSSTVSSYDASLSPMSVVTDSKVRCHW